MLLTILAVGWMTDIWLRMVAPSFVMVTSPFPDWIILSIPRGPREVRTASATAFNVVSQIQNLMNQNYKLSTFAATMLLLRTDPDFSLSLKLVLAPFLAADGAAATGAMLLKNKITWNHQDGYNTHNVQFTMVFCYHRYSTKARNLRTKRCGNPPKVLKIQNNPQHIRRLDLQNQFSFRGISW